GRLDELRAAAEEAERRLATYKAENGFADDEIIKLDAQFSAAQTRTLELNAQAASARAMKIDTVIAGAIPEGIDFGALPALRAQYIALKSQADRTAARLGPRHPERQTIEA